MKKTWSKIAGLCALCAVAATSVQAAVTIDENFTVAEGYVTGALNGPWSGTDASKASYTINTSGTGSLLPSETANFHTITHTTSLGINDSYTVGMEFSFNRASADITDNNNTLFELLLSDGSANVGFGLMRRDGVGLGNQYRLKSNATSVTSPLRFANSGWFNETLLGFADATDNVSDQLRMEATVNRGATATDWTATFVIRNLTTDTEVLAWNRTGGLDAAGRFFLSDTAALSAAIASDEPTVELQVSNRVIDRFFATSIPEPSAALLGGLGLLALLRRRR